MRNEEYREVGYYKLGEQKFSDKAKILTDVHVLKRIIDHSPNQYFTYVHFYLPCNYHGSVVPEIVGRGRQISIEYKGHTYNVDLDYPEASAYVENLLYLQFTISGSLQTMKDATIFAKEIERRMIKQLLENYVNNTQKMLLYNHLVYLWIPRIKFLLTLHVEILSLIISLILFICFQATMQNNQ